MARCAKSELVSVRVPEGPNSLTLVIGTELVQTRGARPARGWTVIHRTSCVLCTLIAIVFTPNFARGDSIAIRECTDAFNPAAAIIGCSAIINSTWANDDQLALAYNNRANAQSDLGLAEAAIADYGRALALDPHYVNASYNRATLYLELGRLELAIADFDRVLTFDPHRANAANNRALAFLKLNNLEEAIEGFSAAIGLDPTDARAYNNRGVAWRRMGERERAIADFTAAIDLLPTYVGAFNSRGELRLEVGQWDQASADFRKAIAIDPNHVKANANLRALTDLITTDSSFR